MRKRTRKLQVEPLEARRLLAFNPTADEQELMQLTNRFRTDPRGEFARLISTASPIRARDPVLQTDLDYFKVNGNTLRSELQSLTPVAPVAWNEDIHNFTKTHNGKMVSAKQHFHSNSTTRRETLVAAGVPLRFRQGEKITSELVYGYGKSPLHIHASYVINWGVGSGGMQNGRSHRTALINDDFEQSGTAITNYAGSNFGPRVNSHVLANIDNPPVMVVGAVFEDTNKSSWYEAGEGLGSVQIVFEGSAGRFTTTSMAAGGYQVELPAGTYTATATGNRMKHPIVVGGISVGSTNVWKNLIYDPNNIPPDRLEANNSLATASAVPTAGGTLAGLSIHNADHDYFRLQPNGTGQATVTVNFAHANGDLDAQILSSSGSVIASATSTSNNERLTANLLRGSTYYVHVYGKGNAKNGSYSLAATLPAPSAPVAVADQAIANNATRTVTVDVLANDSDPDSARSALTVELLNAPPAFQLNGRQVTFQATAGFSGFARAQYRVQDDQGLFSAPTTLSVFSLDFSASLPWQNPNLPLDVDGDGILAPLDALLIINEINRNTSRLLPTNHVGSGDSFGFLDVNGDGYVAPIDALLIINALGPGSGEGEVGNQPPGLADYSAAVDEALAGWPSDFTTERKRQAAPWR